MVIRIVTKRENIGQILDGLVVRSTGLVELDGDIKEKKTRTIVRFLATTTGAIYRNI